MHIRPLHTFEDYDAAVKRIEILMDSKPGDDSFDELDILSTLVAAFDDKHFSLGNPDPIEAIRFRMDQLGLGRSDLGDVLSCGRGRVCEIMTKKRPLSLKMIRTLTHSLNIPSDVLVQEYSLQKEQLSDQRKK